MLNTNCYRHTPIIQQYLSIKKLYPNMFLFFQIGDFYELFYEDAKIATSILKIVLTKKGFSAKKVVPMAGFPCQKINYYCKKLLKLGKSIVICDQVNNKLFNNSLIPRKIVQVITPGTVVNEELLNGKKDNLLVSIFEKDNSFGYSSLNLCLGKLEILEFNHINDLMSEIEKTNPEEILLPKNFAYSFLFNKRIGIQKRSISNFNLKKSYQVLISHFLSNKKQKSKLKTKKLGVRAAGSILQYVKYIKKNIPSHIQNLKIKNKHIYIYMNLSTRKNLEINESKNISNKNGSLLSLINKTSTLMGSRLLKRWLVSPICNTSEIVNRQNSVTILLKNYQKITSILEKFHDLERIITRISLNQSIPKDLVNLRNLLSLLPKLKILLSKILEKNLIRLNNKIHLCKSLNTLLHNAIQPMPSYYINYGNVIATGFSKKLDRWREIAHDSLSYLKKIELKQKKKIGANSLKIGFNKIIGYYLQVNKKDSCLIPNNYFRKQTLKHTERYIIPEIENYQEKILYAKTISIDIEKEIYLSILHKITPFLEKLKKTSYSIAELDVLNNFAKIAINLNYVCPTLTKNYGISIINGRHPIVELAKEKSFIPNSTYLSSKKRMSIITGPNMGGKSTYMRQIAIIVILSYIGSYVPATKASIGPIDKIFTRIGAHDDLYSGKSTFMMEMLETAYILNHATSNSLVIIDELGRGTSPQDGLSLAWSCAKNLAKDIKCMTLFSTHYSELSDLEKKYKNIKNIYFDSLFKNNEIFFNYVLKKGFTEKSYGLSVALLSGFPKKVVLNAKKKLKQIHKEQKLPIIKAIKLIKKINFNKIKPLKSLIVLNFLKKILIN
ncbi:DNA mismatch repair protein MutS [Buchnera aphidicola (Anoecia corni)]|uniref:DNA mismatch repair protein MutS n=1 Tax=Buchnera aphidicola (Anoecia corni) TaxID=2994477 RepID=A0AAT9IGJ5_9GAMM